MKLRSISATGILFLSSLFTLIRADTDTTRDAQFALAAAAIAPKSLTLPQAEMLAVANHPLIGAAEARVQEARQEVGEARAAFFPQVTANATAVGVNGDLSQITAEGRLATSSVESRESDGLMGSQLITDFGRTASLTESAQYHADSEQAKALITRSQVLLNVDQAYFEVLEAQSIVRVANDTVKERQLLLEQVGALAQGKLKSDLDVSFARVDVGQAQMLQLQAQNRLAEAFARFSNALGYQNQRPFELTDVAPFAAPATDLAVLLSHAYENRPELAALVAQHEADVKFINGQRAAQYPTVQALGEAGVSPIRNGQELDDTYAAAGINIGLPVLTGGRLSARVSEAEARAVESQRLLQSEQNDIARDVCTAWLGTTTAYKRIGVAESLLANASQSLDLAQARYSTGISSIIELSQAQLNKTQAEIDTATARYDYQILASNLKYQLGDYR